MVKAEAGKAVPGRVPGRAVPWAEMGGLILRELQQLLAKNFKVYGLNFKSSAEPRAAWLRMQLTALARAAIDIVV